nr:hypothetical protein CFP56_33816 [Quercus suber]
MKDYGVEQSWTKEFVISNAEWTNSIWNRGPVQILNYGLYTKMETMEGAELFILHNSELSAYNAKRHERKIQVCGIDPFHFVIPYVPSLVSLKEAVIGESSQKTKVSQLEGTAYQFEELTKANSNLTTELTALHEHVDKAKVDTMEEFKDSQPSFNELRVQYGELTALRKHVDKDKANAMEEFKDSQPSFNELRVQYGEGFEGIRKQIVLLFPGLDFSSVQVNMTIPITPGGDDERIDVEDEKADNAVKGETVTLMEKEANRQTTHDSQPTLNAPTT